MKKKKKPGTSAKKTKPADWLLLGPALILTFILYSSCFDHYFIINWDDDGYVINNPMVKDLSVKGIISIFTQFHIDNYHPLTTLTNAVEYKLFQLNPKPYHINNVLLHLVNTALVFFFIRQLLKNRRVSLLVALLFAVHPMHAESVAWIAERKDLLYTAFFMGSLILYNRFLAEEKNTYLAGAVFFMLLSCLSKPAAVALTPVLFLLDYYAEKKQTAKTIAQKIPFLLLSLFFGILAVSSQGRSGSLDIAPDFPFTDKLFLASYALMFYIIKLFFPANLSAVYLYPEKISGLLPLEYYLAPAGILLLIISARYFKRIRKDLVFGYLFYFFTIAMVIQLIPVGRAIVAERYSYVPYIGLFFILARLYQMIISGEFRGLQKRKTILDTGIAIFLIILCTGTWNRLSAWKDSYALFSDVIQKQPRNYYGYYARGVGRSLQQDIKGAIEDYSKALQINPRHVDSWYNRGVMREKTGEKSGALSDYTKALESKPDYYKAWYNRGNIKFEKGDISGAIEDYNQTLKLNPVHAEAFCNRGVAWLKLGDTAQAFSNYNESLKLNPRLANALFNRASLYLTQKKIKEACEDFNNAYKEGYADAGKFIDHYCK